MWNGCACLPGCKMRVGWAWIAWKRKDNAETRRERQEGFLTSFGMTWSVYWSGLGLV
jgi:hypothetical protein